MYEDWVVLGACRGEDPAWWYSDNSRSPESKAAKKICAQCVVQADCRDYALRVDEPFGIWGGMTTPERRRQRRACA